MNTDLLMANTYSFYRRACPAWGCGGRGVTPGTDISPSQRAHTHSQTYRQFGNSSSPDQVFGLQEIPEKSHI